MSGTEGVRQLPRVEESTTISEMLWRKKTKLKTPKLNKTKPNREALKRAELWYLTGRYPKVALFLKILMLKPLIILIF